MAERSTQSRKEQRQAEAIVRQEAYAKKPLAEKLASAGAKEKAKLEKRAAKT